MEAVRAWLNGNRNYKTGADIFCRYGTDEALKRMFSEAETPFKKTRLVAAMEQLWAEGKKGKLPPAAKPNTTTITPKKGKLPPKADAKKAPDETVRTKIKELEKTVDEQEQTIEDLEWEKTELEEENEKLQDENATIKKARRRNGWPVAMDETVAALHLRWKTQFLTMVDLQSRLYEVAHQGVKNKEKEREAGLMALKILDLREDVLGIYEQRDHYLENGRLPDPPKAEDECLDPLLWPLKLDNAKRRRRDCRSKLAGLEPGSKRQLKMLALIKKWEGEVAKYSKLLKRDDDGQGE